MRLKNAVTVGLVLFAGGIMAIFLIAFTETSKTDTTAANTNTPTGAASNAAPEAASGATPATVGTPACGAAGGSCTAAEVAAHNSAADCWVIYEGNYYNVTPFIRAHPGGASVFNSQTCGQDIGAYLSGDKASAGKRNEHSAEAMAQLATLKVGPVK
jgi:cytochrome b involved in lipid metabolism